MVWTPPLRLHLYCDNDAIKTLRVDFAITAVAVLRMFPCTVTSDTPRVVAIRAFNPAGYVSLSRVKPHLGLVAVIPSISLLFRAAHLWSIVLKKSKGNSFDTSQTSNDIVIA
jgi:hypothetical protein